MSWLLAIWQVWGTVWLVALSAIAAFGLGCLPVVHHLIFGLRERRREILHYFQPHSILLYFKQFYSSEWRPLVGKPDAEIVAHFEKMYDSRFGKRTFLMPFGVYLLALFTVVLATAYAVLRGSPHWTGVTLETRGLYALAGAYLWVILDLISRYRQRDLVPSALYGYTYRFIFSIPLAYALSTLFMTLPHRRSPSLSAHFRPTP